MRSESRNAVAQHIKEGIRKRRYRNCVHLKVGGSDNQFGEYCEEEAFMRLGEPGTIRRFHQMGEFYCAHDCQYFENQTRFEMGEKFERFSFFMKSTSISFWDKWFKQHWVERVVILFGILVFVLWFVAPRLIPPLFELVGMIFGSSEATP